MMTSGGSLMRLMILLAALVSLAGCAGMTAQPGNEAALADVRAKIALGRCDDGLVQSLARHPAPELEQEAAFVCLQQGEVEAVERLLTGYDRRHRNAPHPDYSAYLLALTQQVRFELAEGEDALQITEGRKAHQRYAEFVHRYPESEYRNDVGPRLNRLLEDMAQAEYRLAQAALEAGDAAQAEARMRYLLRYYPHSSVAREASDWLEQAARGEDDNIAPGTAW